MEPSPLPEWQRALLAKKRAKAASLSGLLELYSARPGVRILRAERIVIVETRDVTGDVTTERADAVLRAEEVVLFEPEPGRVRRLRHQYEKEKLRMSEGDRGSPRMRSSPPQKPMDTYSQNGQEEAPGTALHMRERHAPTLEDSLRMSEAQRRQPRMRSPSPQNPMDASSRQPNREEEAPGAARRMCAAPSLRMSKGQSGSPRMRKGRRIAALQKPMDASSRDGEAEAPGAALRMHDGQDDMRMSEAQRRAPRMREGRRSAPQWIPEKEAPGTALRMRNSQLDTEASGGALRMRSPYMEKIAANTFVVRPKGRRAIDPREGLAEGCAWPGAALETAPRTMVPKEGTCAASPGAKEGAWPGATVPKGRAWPPLPGATLPEDSAWAPPPHAMRPLRGAWSDATVPKEGAWPLSPDATVPKASAWAVAHHTAHRKEGAWSDSTVPKASAWPPSPGATVPKGSAWPPSPDATVPNASAWPPSPDTTVPNASAWPPSPDATVPKPSAWPPSHDATVPNASAWPPSPGATVPNASAWPPSPGATIPNASAWLSAPDYAPPNQSATASVRRATTPGAALSPCHSRATTPKTAPALPDPMRYDSRHIAHEHRVPVTLIDGDATVPLAPLRVLSPRLEGCDVAAWGPGFESHGEAALAVAPGAQGKVARYPSAEEIEVIGGYLALERSCMRKGGARRRKKLKISFDDLHTMFEYPSENSLEGQEAEEEEEEVEEEEEEEEEYASEVDQAPPLPAAKRKDAGFPISAQKPQSGEFEAAAPRAGTVAPGADSPDAHAMLTPAGAGARSDFGSEPALYF